ncbi:hypothetical protein EfmJHP10_17990 [Enterococcus faecium]|nr:hypothetical protein EfmJHP10_17990 [Enterococcus faecium]
MNIQTDSSEKMDYQKKWTSTKSIKDSSHPLRPKEDVIIGRAERTFSCSVSTLYRRFKTGEFNVIHLPMQGKRKPN